MDKSKSMMDTRFRSCPLKMDFGQHWFRFRFVPIQTNTNINLKSQISSISMRRRFTGILSALNTFIWYRKAVLIMASAFKKNSMCQCVKSDRTKPFFVICCFVRIGNLCARGSQTIVTNTRTASSSWLEMIWSTLRYDKRVLVALTLYLQNNATQNVQKKLSTARKKLLAFYPPPSVLMA